MSEQKCICKCHETNSYQDHMLGIPRTCFCNDRYGKPEECNLKHLPISKELYK